MVLEILAIHLLVHQLLKEIGRTRTAAKEMPRKLTGAVLLVHSRTSMSRTNRASLWSTVKPQLSAEVVLHPEAEAKTEVDPITTAEVTKEVAVVASIPITEAINVVEVLGGVGEIGTRS